MENRNHSSAGLDLGSRFSRIFIRGSSFCAFRRTARETTRAASRTAGGNLGENPSENAAIKTVFLSGATLGHSFDGAGAATDRRSTRGAGAQAAGDSLGLSRHIYARSTYPVFSRAVGIDAPTAARKGNSAPPSLDRGVSAIAFSGPMGARLGTTRTDRAPRTADA